tara:strand:+ start:2066 stop:2290 length:225 start_codon:yes stop_codon:yes gene_type:complete
MASPSEEKVKFLLRVEAGTLETLRSTASVRGVSLSQLLRDILNDYVRTMDLSDVEHKVDPYSVPKKKEEKNWWE